MWMKTFKFNWDSNPYGNIALMVNLRIFMDTMGRTFYTTCILASLKSDS